MRLSKQLIAVVASLVLAVVACGSDDPAGPGGHCGSNDDCKSGLECIEFSILTTTCTVGGKHCTKRCTDDPECDTLKSGFRCRANCAGVANCQ